MSATDWYGLSTPELAYVRSRGLRVAEKCDGCGKLLNQTIRFTITGKPEVYRSTICRDNALFADRHEAKKRATPGRCTYCGGSLKGKKCGSVFCDEACRKAHSRKIKRITTAEVDKSRTPPQSNQAVGDAKSVEHGNRITRPLHGLKIVTSDPNPPQRESAVCGE